MVSICQLMTPERSVKAIQMKRTKSDERPYQATQHLSSEGGLSVRGRSEIEDDDLLLAEREGNVPTFDLERREVLVQEQSSRRF